MNVLLRLIVPEGLLQQLKQTAKWPDEAPQGENTLKKSIEDLIKAVVEIAPVKTDWGNIQACKQSGRRTVGQFRPTTKRVQTTFGFAG